jgi:hypothetical protein
MLDQGFLKVKFAIKSSQNYISTTVDHFFEQFSFLPDEHSDLPFKPHFNQAPESDI